MKTIPMENWGQDHISTMLYLETVMVDYSGKIDPRRMRRDGDQYPTRLKDGALLKGHTDYDCLDDFVAAGLVENSETGIKLTNAGWGYAHKLRRERAVRRATS